MDLVRIIGISVLLSLTVGWNSVNAAYWIGVGIADCTGPAAEIVFMGFAKMSQKGCGIHLRQFSRAFIFDDGISRSVFVTVDAAMMSHGVRREVLKSLKDLYNGTYTESNVIISGTHTHGTPGGFLMDLMFDFPSFGFVHDTFQALVDGIIKSIINAHNNVDEGKIYFNSGILLDANINRSPASYLLNPEEERKQYDYNVDKEMVQLKLVRSHDESIIGMISWFAIHPNSMNNTNCLVTSDNVGYASIMLEKDLNNNALSGKGGIVAAFASTNLGDVSPNTKGPICINSGELCDFNTSTCKGGAKYCIASGPGANMVESTKIIASKLYEKAKELLGSKPISEVTGPVKFIHQYVNMGEEKVPVVLPNGTLIKGRGCLPAMGYSFAAGTTDGPGEFNFSQGIITDNPFWNVIRNFVSRPTADDIACHAPKPILLNTGKAIIPYEWQPFIVSTQLILIGDVILISVPGEFTTMSGRRLRNVVKQTLGYFGNIQYPKPIITGLSNVYTSYIATFEEYQERISMAIQLQRYEGASTLFGPHTLSIYLNKYTELAKALIQGEKLDHGPTPPDFSSRLITLVTPVIFDNAGGNKNFGDCITQPRKTVKSGTTASAKFVAGHPRNNLMHGESFLEVEKLIDEEDRWAVIATDASWETRFIWKRTHSLFGESEVTIEWDVDENVDAGVYRIRHFGHYKKLSGKIIPYQGVTKSFNVTR